MERYLQSAMKLIISPLSWATQSYKQGNAETKLMMKKISFVAIEFK